MRIPARLPQKVVAEELEELIPGVSKLDLGLKEMRFIAAYISHDFNAVEAYDACNSVKKPKLEKGERADNNSSAKKGLGMLKKKKVQDALTIYMKAFIGEHKDKLEYKILNQLYLRAFYNPFDVIKDDGSLKSEKEMAHDHKQLVVGIKKTMHPKDPGAYTIEVKLADRDKARVELEKYINMLHVDDKASLHVDISVKENLRNILGGVKNSGFHPLPKKQKRIIDTLGDE